MLGCNNRDVRRVVCGFWKIKWRGRSRSFGVSAWGLGSGSGSGGRRSTFIRVGFKSGGNFCLLGVVSAEEGKAGSVSFCSNNRMGKNAIGSESLVK